MSLPALKPGAPRELDGAAGAERFEALTRRLRMPLLRYFTRRTGSQPDSEELVQDLFLRLLRRPGLMNLESIDGYVFEAAANLLRDKAKRERTRPMLGAVDIDGIDLADDLPGAEDVVGGRQSLERIQVALKSLSPRARTIVILRRFEDMSHAQIAARLNISVSAVEKHLVRAMAVLRHALREQG
ncbi:RNA polymerase subunit sigma-24 [Caulobacter flavus]|jgi:RNA polymerase sigma factor (sigma-70 family)|uniref:RNA polymerase subunit sigma-24 n=1 Tax=Caulobacter flavus TaxID=1679497 RepID=A0A2N5CU90_9CAUL|nr:sigma-70 family RNA polymerase sigma factor [Caulobacter flavus]AYV47997.1 RNA polymerase subunit sigma-24 [Caulobacter flavus]PLR16553.1 RNA polymerase subunit sigma-24 [Caulobacter flavus]